MWDDEVYSRNCPECGSLITEEIMFTEAYQSYEQNLIVCKHCKSELEIKMMIVLVKV